MSRAAYSCAFVTKGQVVSTTFAPVASAPRFTSGPTPCDRMTMVAPGVNSSSDPATWSPRRWKAPTTWGLWIKGPRACTVPAAWSSVSFAILIARFTPKQKPALSATITSMGSIRLLVRTSKRSDRVHDAPRVSPSAFPGRFVTHRGHHRLAVDDPDLNLPEHRQADLTRTGDPRRNDHRPRRSRQPCDAGFGRKELLRLAPRPLGEDEHGPAVQENLLGALESTARRRALAHGDGIITPDQGTE